MKTPNAFLAKSPSTSVPVSVVAGLGDSVHAEAVRRRAEARRLQASEGGFLMPVIMDADRMGRTLTRIAHEIVERNRGTEHLALVGIRTRGDVLAKRLAKVLEQITNEPLRTGALDITLYRDDLMRHTVGAQPLVRRTEIPFSIDDQKILLVDDVLYTGRTIRAALDALIDFGRPKEIQLIVLVDRGHRELPIKADYVGKNVPTSLKEIVTCVCRKPTAPTKCRSVRRHKDEL